MIRLKDILIVAIITGCIFGAGDILLIATSEQELILTPLRLVLTILISLVSYSALFIVVGLLYTALVSLFNTLRRFKRPSFSISPGALLGAFIFVIYVLAIGYYVNVNILPEKHTPISIWGNIGILVSGVILWFIIYRIVLYYTSAVRNTRSFLYRTVTVIGAIGIFIVIMIAGTRFMGLDIFREEKINKNNAILILVTPENKESVDKITKALENRLKPDLLYTLYYSLPNTTDNNKLLLSTLFSNSAFIEQTGDTENSDYKNVQPAGLCLHNDEYTTSAFISSEYLIGYRFLSDGFSLYDDIFSVYGSTRRLIVFQMLHKMGIFHISEKPYRDATSTLDNLFRWLKFQAKPPFFTFTEIGIKDKEENLEDIADSIEQIQGYIDEKGLEDTTITIICFLMPEKFNEQDIIMPENIMYPLLIIAPFTEMETYRYTAVSHLDIAPTILDHLDAEIPDFIQGFSILPIISGFTPDRSIYTDGDAIDVYVDDGFCVIRNSDDYYFYEQDRMGRWLYTEELPEYTINLLRSGVDRY